MNLTQEMIASRKMALLKQMEKLQSDLSATAGAIQDCVYWEAQLAKPEPDAPAAKA